MDIYEQIRKDNLTSYGTKVSDYIKIIIQQYSERTHFIYETIQNAEDAKATKIRFQLFPDRLEILHNGRPFNEKDIRGICSIAAGTKAEDQQQIGHFGIGFKAVYGYTMTPRIYSGDTCFEIENFVSPRPISTNKTEIGNNTLFVLPFNNAEVAEKTAFKEIENALWNQINADSIIMLSNITKLTFEIPEQEKFIEIEKHNVALDSSRRVYKIVLNTVNDHNTESKCTREYLIFSDGRAESAKIAFNTDENGQLLPITNSKVYAFFPTAKESHQNFLIQAPFDTTPARDNFKIGDEFGKHNIELIQQICSVIQYAFLWLRDNHRLNIETLAVLYPIYNYEKGDILRRLYTNSAELIENGEKIIPTNNNNEFKSISEICIPESSNIADVFSDKDLQILFDSNKSWISKEIVKERYADFRKYLIANFNVETLHWKDLLDHLDNGYLSCKNVKWYENLFDEIYNFTNPNNHHQSNFYDVSNIPFIRLNDGHNVSANSHPTVYLNNPSNSIRKINDDFINNESIYNFYKEVLYVGVYDDVKEVREQILPKYKSANITFLKENHLEENISDLHKIENAFQKDPMIRDELTQCYLLTDDNVWYRPFELHVRSEDTKCGYSILPKNHEIKYLSEKYDYQISDEFLLSIGCIKGLGHKQLSQSEYLKAAKKYLSSSQYLTIEKVLYKEYLQNDSAFLWNYDGFPEVLQNVTFDQSVDIMRFLNANWVELILQDEIEGADNKAFTKNVETVFGYTAVGLEICFEKWLYDKDGNGPFRAIDMEKSDISSAYVKFAKIIQKIPFKDKAEKIMKLIDAPGLSEQQKEELARCISKNPKELLDMIQAKKKSDARAEVREKSSTIHEQLKALNRSQTKMREESEPEYNPISQRGLETRSKKIEEELETSMDFMTGVKKGFSFTSRYCNEEERQFLDSEYDGHCQICGKKITKYNGDSYFEAIQMIKRSSLAEERKNSLQLGWNALCLCPNCAAMYNNSSKKISDMYQQIQNTEIEADSDLPIEISIEMPVGEHKTIKYSPRHFLALKKALEIE